MDRPLESNRRKQAGVSRVNAGSKVPEEVLQTIDLGAALDHWNG